MSIFLITLQQITFFLCIRKPHFANPANLHPIVRQFTCQIDPLDMQDTSQRWQNLGYFVAVWNIVISEWQFGEKRPNAPSQEAQVCNRMIICIILSLPAVNYSNNGALIDAIGSNETIAPYDFLLGPFSFILRRIENLIENKSAYMIAYSLPSCFYDSPSYFSTFSLYSCKRFAFPIRYVNWPTKVSWSVKAGLSSII